MVATHTSAPKTIRLVEKIERKILRPLMSNFRNVAEALFELVDNPVDQFDGVRGGRHLTINVEVRRDKDSIVVENIGGLGMGPEELQGWLDWGRTPEHEGISEYGQGGKAAMGFLGNAWSMRTKRYDDPWVWEVRDDNWSDDSVAQKILTATPLYEDGQHRGVGYCRIEIKRLVPRKRLGGEQLVRLKNQLGDCYRKLLEDRTLTITLNGEPVKPLQLPLYDAFKPRRLSVKTTGGIHASAWSGRLKRDSRSRSPVSIKGGFRLLRRGRLICDGEYFGHPGPAYKASLNTLIGELEVPRAVPVLPNKTDFNRDSAQWEEIRAAMHDAIKPDIDELLRQPDEDKVTKEEKQRVRHVRDLMMKTLQNLAQQGDANIFSADGRGRRAPTPHPEPTRTNGPTQTPAIPKAGPKTPPPTDAVGRLRRLGMMPDWLPDVLDPDIRSTWREEGSRRILVINKRFPLAELRNLDELYIAETATLELAKPFDGEDKAVKEYADDVNRLMKAFCDVLAEG